MYRFAFVGVVLFLLGGCASHGVVENVVGPQGKGRPSYSLGTFQERWRTDDNAVMLAFSGGGTQAAYGLKDFDKPMDEAAERAPLSELVDIMNVERACAYLATPQARRITGGTFSIDGGVNVMA